MVEYSILLKLSPTIKFLLKQYLQVQIYYILGHFFARREIIDLLIPIWFPGCREKGQNFQFILNEGQYKISDDKLSLCANF